MSPASRYITCAGYEIHVTEWGAPDAPAVIAWHGLARTRSNPTTGAKPRRAKADTRQGVTEKTDEYHDPFSEMD